MFVTLTNAEGKRARLQIARIENFFDHEGGSMVTMASGNHAEVAEKPEEIEQLCMDAMVEWSVEISSKAAQAGARMAKKVLEDE